MKMSFIVLLPGLLLAAAASAQVRLDTLTVSTASRESEAVDAALASVSVIDRDTIDRSVAPDLLELLRLEAGVELARSGGAGGQTSLFLRGSNFNHVLVLVDGVRIANANTGAAAWENLPLAQIERIEIVRGPRAALYGSDAIGGVVQIFTRAPRKGRIDAASGRYDSHSLALAWGRQGEHGSAAAVASRRQSRGFSAQNPRGFAFDPDRDGYRNDSLGLRAARVIGTQRLDLGFMAVDAEVDFDQGESSARTRSAHATLSGPLRASWDHRLLLTRSQEDLATPTFFSAFRSRRHGLDWLHGIDLTPAQRLQLGASWQHERGASLDTFSDSTQYGASRRNSAAFARWRGDRGTHRFELAWRHDDNSVFGGASTGQAGWSWQPTARWRVLAHWGEGFRAPNLNEQFSPGFGGLFAGNPDLEPERSKQWEVGLAMRPDTRQEFRLHAYRNRVRNLISFSGGETFRAENIDRTDLEGVEFLYSLILPGWRARSALTWQKARDADSGEPLRRRAPRFGSVLVETREWPLDVGIELFASAARPDIAERLPGYALLNLRMERRLGPQWVLRGRLENALDRSYEHAAGFNTAGRSLWLLLTWSDHN